MKSIFNSVPAWNEKEVETLVCDFFLLNQVSQHGEGPIYKYSFSTVPKDEKSSTLVQLPHSNFSMVDKYKKSLSVMIKAISGLDVEEPHLQYSKGSYTLSMSLTSQEYEKGHRRHAEDIFNKSDLKDLNFLGW